MKNVFRISLGLNATLIAGLTFLLVNQNKTTAVLPLVLREAKLPAQGTIVSAPATPPQIVTQPFLWSDLHSSNGYRDFVANLRAIGCPETSIADIVRGNVGRAFSWERGQLHLDGSGNGPWSQASEIALINDLMGNSSPPRLGLYSQNAGERPAEMLQVAPRQGTGNTPQVDMIQVAQLSGSQSNSQNVQTPPSSSILLAQGGTWNANAARTAAVSANESSGGQGQQSDAIGSSQQISGSGPQVSGDANSLSVPATSANGQASSDDPFTKSAQDIMAQQLTKYYDWYQPQVIAATASGKPLFINPDAFSPN